MEFRTRQPCARRPELTWSRSHAWLMCLAAGGLAAVLAAPRIAHAAPVAPVHHDLSVTLDPAAQSLNWVDRITFHGQAPTGFTLHAALAVTCRTAGVRIEPLAIAATNPDDSTPDDTDPHLPPRRSYRIVWPSTEAGAPAARELVLAATGVLHHPLEQEAEEYARSFSRTPGLIDARGVFLSGTSAWVPDFAHGMLTFDLTVQLPAGWEAVSQGARGAGLAGEVPPGTPPAGGSSAAGDSTPSQAVLSRWICAHPMEEIYLIAGPFTVTTRAAGNVSAQTFLRSHDPALAARYLEATAQYLELYRQLIGPYPYEKFALVENFWETGYGMPSFTLLGPKIIRFPFILHSSYPHEILHNWWGNSVFVDARRGNWCEGLTAYLADHLIKEGQGKGTEYRRDTLKKYLDYVRTGNEIALREFRERHSSASEAVGYGKSLMMFHMLRRRLGDATFVRALQRFYREQRFRQASFDDLGRAFSSEAGVDLGGWLAQWIDRPGAPELAIDGHLVRGSRAQGYTIELRLAQRQPGPAYELQVPVGIHLNGEAAPRLEILDLHTDVQEYQLEVPSAPLHIQIDPYCDVFRRLDRREVPPTAGEVFGAGAVTIVLPTSDPDGPVERWQELAAAWTAPGVEVLSEDQIDVLPAERPVWVLGSENRWRSALLPALAEHGAQVEAGTVTVDDQRLATAGHSFLFVARHGVQGDLAIGWVGGGPAAAAPGLARKLPHYGRYSYLVFEGDEPANVIKGQWSTSDSPLVIDLRYGPEETGLDVDFPEREPLARVAPVFDGAALGAHVRYLADPAREGRGIGTAGLDAAAEYIAQRFAEAGLLPGGDDGGYFQAWSEPDGPDGQAVTLRNVIGVLPGTRAEWTTQSVVVGAHYDHLGRGWPDVRAGHEGQIHPGADDNASGVATLIETARLMARTNRPARSLVFVAFSGEEWGLRGSRRYVEHAAQYPARNALAMVNLDAVGRLGPNKLLVLGSATATEWVHIVRGVGFTTGVEGQAVPDDPGGSDQVSFQRIGVPAVQLCTGAHEDYHRPSDTVEKVDLDGMVRVATFLRETISYLGDRDRPLTPGPALTAGTGPPESAAAPVTDGSAGPDRGPAAGSRSASFGVVPAYADPGPGVLLDDVVSGSPAAGAGLAKSDRLLIFDGHELANLRDYSEQLRRRAPGDRVRIVYERAGARHEATVVLVPR